MKSRRYSKYTCGNSCWNMDWHTLCIGSRMYAKIDHKKTSLPIITNYCQSGTIVWSDMWSGYNYVRMLAPVARYDI